MPISNHLDRTSLAKWGFIISQKDNFFWLDKHGKPWEGKTHPSCPLRWPTFRTQDLLHLAYLHTQPYNNHHASLNILMKFPHYKITQIGIGNKGNSESNKVEHWFNLREDVIYSTTCMYTHTPWSSFIFAFIFIWSLVSFIANFLASLFKARPALCSVVTFIT